MIQLSTFIIIVSVVVSINAFTSKELRFQKEALRRTNKLRERHCVPPLELDSKLSKTAQKYAEYLAAANKFQVSTTDYGENIFRINVTKSMKIVEGGEPIQFWYDAIKGYNYTDNPIWSVETATATAVIWKSTKKFGIGFAFQDNGHTAIIVGFYYPRGNVKGQISENVLKSEC